MSTKNWEMVLVKCIFFNRVVKSVDASSIAPPASDKEKKATVKPNPAVP
jgi:hypothetical protein